MNEKLKKRNPYPLKIEGAGELKCRRHFFIFFQEKGLTVRQKGNGSDIAWV